MLAAALLIASWHAQTVSASWTPLQLPNLALWLDGSDAATLYQDTAGTQPITNNGAVARWNDKSGNSRNFTQSTSASRPTYVASSINARGAATFNGSTSFMTAGDRLDVGTANLTVMTVIQHANTTQSASIIAKSRYAAAAGRWGLYRIKDTSSFFAANSSQYYGASTPSRYVLNTAADVDTSARLIGFDWVRTGTTSQTLYNNGSILNSVSGHATDSTPYDSTDELWIGAYQGTTGTIPATTDSYLNGKIAEVVITATDLSTTERQALEGYLAWKWGTQAKLPLDHLFKNAPPDTTPPSIVARSPINGATSVTSYTNLSATFDKNIQKGRGTIAIRKFVDDSVVATFDIATSSRITVSGSTLTIDPANALPGLTGHYVVIDSGAIKDLLGNSYAGTSDSGSWNFTTGAADTIPPSVATLDSPPAGSTDVSGSASLVLSFDEPITKGAGNIVIRSSSDGSVVDTINVTAANVIVNGAQVTILPNVILPVAGGVYVEMDAGTFLDISGNPFGGISSASDWSFSTAPKLAIAPNQPDSVFQLSWPSSAGQNYNLRSSPNLMRWDLLQGNIPATPPINILNINPDEMKMFYTAEAAPPPFGNASFEFPMADGFLSSVAPRGWTEWDPGNVGNVGTWNPLSSDYSSIPDGENIAAIYHGTSIPQQAYGIFQAVGQNYAQNTDYQISVEVGRSATHAWPGYRIELWAGTTKIAEDDNSLTPAANTWLTSTVTCLHSASNDALIGQPLTIRLLSRGQDPNNVGAGGQFRVAFDQVSFTATPAAMSVVNSVRLVMPAQPSGVVSHLASVFGRQISQRCPAAVITEGTAPFIVEFATAADAGAEGYRIENRSGGGVRIVGGGDRGLSAGIGKFLRTSRYDQGGFTPATWRGASQPLKASRGIYFATHFHNYYHDAPIAEIQRYVEDLALWGFNELVVWYDLHHFNGKDDPAAVAFRARLRAIMVAAKQIGMDVSLTVIGNEGYANSPVELRASGVGRGGYYPCHICPHKPNFTDGGKDYILDILGHQFDWAADLSPRSLWIWPFDQGGCDTADCLPWATNGFMYCAEKVGELARLKMPGTKIFLSTWLMTGAETSTVANMVAAQPALADGLVIEGNIGPAAIGLGKPIVGFPEISMHDTFPWGGFGATPLTARAQGEWNAVKGSVSGGFPYSEGIYEDITKIAYSQFYWSDQTAAQTVREYIAFEFSPAVVDEISAVVQTLEQNHHFRWWPGKLEGVPLELNWFPSYGEAPRADPGAEQAYATMQEVNARLTPQARTSWRWRQLYLRALLDSELKTNGGSPNARCNAAFAELIQIYHAENANPHVRPPLP